MGTVSDTEYIPRDAVDKVLLELEDRVINNPFALTANEGAKSSISFNERVQ